jgi:hypothetical protein
MGNRESLHATAPGAKHARRYLPDADIVVLLIALSPIFLTVVIRSVLRGDVLDVGWTICAAAFALSIAMAISAWRARR